MTWFQFVLINQAKYNAQDTGNCLPTAIDCDKTSENESGKL